MVVVVDVADVCVCMEGGGDEAGVCVCLRAIMGGWWWFAKTRRREI